ncbi:hypothetical protein WA158_000595 [Blastocystis sp. Blastoise]
MFEFIGDVILFIVGMLVGKLIRYVYMNYHRHLSFSMNYVNLESAAAFDFFMSGLWNEDYDEKSFCRRRDWLASVIDNLTKKTNFSNYVIDYIELPCDLDPKVTLKLYLVTPKSLVNIKSPLLIYLHGGGFVWGDWASKNKACLKLSEGGFRVLYVEYFICPDYKAPYQGNNMKQALKWVLSNGEHYNIDINKLILMGQSAGASLINPSIIMHRDEHLPGKILGIYMYGSVSGGVNLPSYQRFRYGYGINYRQVIVMYGVLFNTPEELITDYHDHYSAITDYTDFPPFYIFSCQCDCLQDSAETFATFLKSAGVPVYVRKLENTVHGFFNHGKDGKQAVQDVINIVNNYIAFEVLTRKYIETENDDDILKGQKLLEKFYPDIVVDPQFDVQTLTITNKKEDYSFRFMLVRKKELLKKEIPLLIYCHAGGFIFGNWKINANTVFHLAESNVCVLYVEYLLGPKYPYPIQNYNIYEALVYVLDRSSEYTIDINRLLIMGQSQGMNSIPYILHKHHQEQRIGTFLLAISMYGSLPLGSHLDSFSRYKSGFGINYSQFIRCKHILYHNKDYYYEDYKKYFSPDLDYSYFPPFHMYICEYDILKSSSIQYEKILKKHHVPVKVFYWKKTVHGFFESGKEGLEALSMVQNELKTYT